MGYHLVEIKKGVYGKFSKIEEEFAELQDAYNQKNKILQICELSDLFGAIEEHLKVQYSVKIETLVTKNEYPVIFDDLGFFIKDFYTVSFSDKFRKIKHIIELLLLYTKQNFNLTFDDLKSFSDLTKSAFIEGKR